MVVLNNIIMKKGVKRLKLKKLTVKSFIINPYNNSNSIEISTITVSSNACGSDLC